MFLDAEQLKSASQVANFKPLVELKNIDNAGFKPEHKRGFYFLFIVNTLEKGVYYANIQRGSTGYGLHRCWNYCLGAHMLNCYKTR